MATEKTPIDGAPDVRVDPHLGHTVHVVAARQSRPNLPANPDVRICPFCVGGLEAPDPYTVRWFPNRWPAMPDERCEVVLYSPDHDASFASIGAAGVRRVIDLWAERTSALGSRADVDYVLVFENRGASIGATISHPHGQIYAYDHVPDRPGRLFAAGWSPDPSEVRLVASNESFICSTQFAPVHPVALTVAPRARRPDLPSLDDHERDQLAALLVDVLSRIERLHDGAVDAVPYMLWVNQRPASGSPADAWMSIEIVSPWRAPDLPRYIAAAELGAGEYFNPVSPEDLAGRLRELERP